MLPRPFVAEPRALFLDLGFCPCSLARRRRQGSFPPAAIARFQTDGPCSAHLTPVPFLLLASQSPPQRRMHAQVSIHHEPTNSIVPLIGHGGFVGVPIRSSSNVSYPATNPGRYVLKLLYVSPFTCSDRMPNHNGSSHMKYGMVVLGLCQRKRSEITVQLLLLTFRY